MLFPYERFRLYILGGNITEKGDLFFSLPPMRKPPVLIGPVTENDRFIPLINVVSARVLLWKTTTFSLGINLYFMEGTLILCKYPISHQIPTNFSICL